MTRKRTSDNELVVSNTGAASVPARRKPAARTRNQRQAAPAESTLTSAAEPVTQAVAAAAEPAHEEIARLAYLYWEARGCQGGCAEEDWLRAEAELRTRATAAIA
jgi:hypothetical protein